MPDAPEIKIYPLTNIFNLCYGVINYSRNTLSYEEIYTYLNKYYTLGYEVSVDGVPKGWAYALRINDLYTLDGHNYGVSIFTASKMGKMVCDDLFKEYTIFTAHYSEEEHLDALVKRIGFKKHGILQDITVFYRTKSWE